MGAVIRSWSEKIPYSESLPLPYGTFSPAASPKVPHKPRLQLASCSSLHLTWSLPHVPPSSHLSPSPPTNEDIVGYTVRYRALVDSEWMYTDFEVGDQNDTDEAEEVGGQGVIEGLMPSQSYEVQVQTLSKDRRNSSFSESLIATTTPAGMAHSYPPSLPPPLPLLPLTTSHLSTQWLQITQ